MLFTIIMLDSKNVNYIRKEIKIISVNKIVGSFLYQQENKAKHIKYIHEYLELNEHHEIQLSRVIYNGFSVEYFVWKTGFKNCRFLHDVYVIIKESRKFSFQIEIIKIKTFYKN